MKTPLLLCLCLSGLMAGPIFMVGPANLAGSAFARGWQPPEGCEIFMTVQAKGCRVSNHYRCEGDTPGDQWRADFDQEGLAFRSRINRETEWVESHEINPPVMQLLTDTKPDPASFSELLSAGIDTFEFNLLRDDATQTLVTGFDRLTGRKLQIDGVALEETEFEAVQLDPVTGAKQASRGNEYINREMRLFFAGPGQVDLGDETWLPIDGSPMTFTFPGDKGFAATQPLFDCDPFMAQAPTTPPHITPMERLWQAYHDR